jgi:hypothetical protein
MRPALVVAHPGHELFVYGWMKRERPRVYVLTDGSGRSAEGSRIEGSVRLASVLDCECGALLGPYGSEKLYAAVLRGDAAPLVDGAHTLAEDWERRGVDHVLGDAWERQILGHDLCRFMIGAALAMVRRRTGREITTSEYPIYGYHGERSPVPRGRLERELLPWDSVDAKIAAAAFYEEPSFEAEVEALVRERGREAFRLEERWRVPVWHGYVDPETSPPRWEEHGERLVRDGVRSETIRYREHVAPLLDRLRAAV